MGFSRSAIWRTAYAIPPLLVTIKFGYTVGSIEGRSMQPHFNPDTSGTRRDIVLLDRYSPMSGHYNHGDVVILTAPHNPEMKLVKRIVGLGGDAVRPRSGAQEGIGNWVKDTRKDGYVRIPRGHCWIESDEPFRGVDSNVFGPVPLGLIDARVAFVLWPFDRFHKVERHFPKPGRVVRTGQLLLETEDMDLVNIVSI